MTKKKKKSTPAENLIESLMNDVKGIQADSSYHAGRSDDDNYKGLPTVDDNENRVERTNARGNVWDNLESDLNQDSSPSMVLGNSDFTSSAEKSEYASTGEDEDSILGEMELPDGWAGGMPSADEENYKGPSIDAGYQTPDELESRPPPVPQMKSPKVKKPVVAVSAADDDSTRPVIVASSHQGGEDKTVSIQQDLNVASSIQTSSTTRNRDGDKTIAVEGFANARLGKRKTSDVDVKVSVGSFRGGHRPGSANVFTSVDASLAQAENLKIAQQRILELEKEAEFLRAENEELASAGEIIRSRTEDLAVRINAMEKEKAEIAESAHSEMLILKGNLQYKENEGAKARLKVEELEARLKSDFKKIRVRERELENRLELLRAEKAALVRSKDEYILEQKRKVDQLSQELDNYRKKCLELNKALDANQDQFKRTERALRLALTNLESKEENLVPLKKAD
ncbi:hypothetical protein D3C87_1163270 [compost metagenome]